MVYLRQLSVGDGTIFYDMLQKIEKEVFAMHNVVNGATYDEYEAWLKEMDDWANSRNLPNGYVKQKTYWLMDSEMPVGYVRLRFELNDKSREYGGSFGYAISSEYRNKGYGTLLIQKLLEIAQEEKIEEFMSMVDKNNVASNRIMQKCGGKIFKENEIYNYYRFW